MRVVAAPSAPLALPSTPVPNLVVAMERVRDIEYRLVDLEQRVNELEHRYARTPIVRTTAM